MPQAGTRTADGTIFIADTLFGFSPAGGIEGWAIRYKRPANLA
jgi:hypothetical protein